MMKKEIAMHQSEIKMEKSKMIPNWSIGMSAMTIEGYQNINGTDIYYNKSTWFPTINAGIQIPLPNGNQRKIIALAEMRMQQTSSMQDWQKKQIESQIKTRHEQDLMRVQVINELSEKKKTTMDPSWKNWQSQWEMGNINALQWSMQVGQWIDFIQTMQSAYSNCIENQYQLQMLQIHE